MFGLHLISRGLNKNYILQRFQNNPSLYSERFRKWDKKRLNCQKGNKELGFDRIKWDLTLTIRGSLINWKFSKETFKNLQVSVFHLKNRLRRRISSFQITDLRTWWNCGEMSNLKNEEWFYLWRIVTFLTINTLWKLAIKNETQSRVYSNY